MIHVIITSIWVYLFNALPYMAIMNLILSIIIFYQLIKRKK